MTPPDLENLCREAALNALRRSISAAQVAMADFRTVLATLRPSLTAAMLAGYEQYAARAAK